MKVRRCETVGPWVFMWVHQNSAKNTVFRLCECLGFPVSLRISCSFHHQWLLPINCSPSHFARQISQVYNFTIACTQNIVDWNPYQHRLASIQFNLCISIVQIWFPSFLKTTGTAWGPFGPSQPQDAVTLFITVADKFDRSIAWDLNPTNETTNESHSASVSAKICLSFSTLPHILYFKGLVPCDQTAERNYRLPTVLKMRHHKGVSDALHGPQRKSQHVHSPTLIYLNLLSRYALGYACPARSTITLYIQKHIFYILKTEIWLSIIK